MTVQDEDAPMSASEKLAAAVARKAAERGGPGGGMPDKRRAQRDANARAASQSRPAPRK